MHCMPNGQRLVDDADDAWDDDDTSFDDMDFDDAAFDDLPSSDWPRAAVDACAPECAFDAR
jgi:hypothetical protein